MANTICYYFTIVFNFCKKKMLTIEYLNQLFNRLTYYYVVDPTIPAELILQATADPHVKIQIVEGYRILCTSSEIADLEKYPFLSKFNPDL